MSQSDADEINRREVAYRLFAAEFEDADYSYAESDEERAPNYVVTPTGARVNRMFVVGVLTEVEQVSDDVVRARVVDPTGAFVIYAGQYQPEALAALESAETPSFVAVTGKARTFEPDDADVIYTSIRPEEVSEVDAETRDRWVVTTAERTVDRVATMAAAHERVERGDNLRSILEAAGVQDGLAAGIPLALDHYGVTPAYLDAVRDLALAAARVVAGETTEAGELSLSPSDGGDVPLPFAATLDVDESAVEAAAGGTDTADDATDTEPVGDEPADEAADEQAETGTDEEASEDESVAETDATVEADTDGEPESAAAQPVAGGPDAETPDPTDVAEEAAPAGVSAAEDEEATGGDGVDAAGNDEVDAEATGDDEMYELSEDEREEVKENYDVEFSTGTDIPESAGDESTGAEPDADGTGSESGDTEVDEPDDETADDLGDFDPGDDEVDTGDDASDADDEPSEAEDEPTDADDDFDAEDEAFDESQADADTSTDFTEDEYDEPESTAADAEGSEPDLDLEDYVVDLMESLDDGDGALREAVVATAADDLDADEGEIEDAIQDALMSGRCYESGDDHLKAI